jgi:vitamin B12 transporter
LKFGLSEKICLTLTALLVAAVSSARGGEIDDSQTIGLFSDEKPALATSPIPRPISRIAENVTVITADDILRLNAHTLAEVLQTVPGIQLDINLRTPSTFTFFNVQGALSTTVLVLVDGIRQNDYDQNMANPSLIPVQQIERIEIIKGAASGSWGSALGGVINIVTKSAKPDKAVSGVLSSSIGSRFTSDSRAELSGTKERVGYYLTAGHLRSDGLQPNSGTRMENLYGKLSYALPGEGNLTLGGSHIAAEPGLDEGVSPRRGFVHDNGENRRDYGFLKLQQPLTDKLGFEIQGYATGRDDREKFGGHDGGGNIVFFDTFAVQDATRGVNASLSWGDERQNIVAGGEYGHVHGKFLSVTDGEPPVYDHSWDRYAAYLNGTYSIGELSILPGIRFDSTGLWGDYTSYSLGLTYQLGQQTTLRAYAANGFSIPMLALDTGIQKVRTVQGGIETGVVPFLWLKGTYFFNTVRNSESLGLIANVTTTDQDRQGVELEVRTDPVYGVSLAGAYTYLYAEDVKSGQQLQTNSQQSVPPHLYKLAVNYDNVPLGLRGALTGSGVIWNAPQGYPASAKGIIWDLNLSWRPGVKSALTPELFFSAHNLFDGVQTTNTILYTNASRWYEGGARLWF